MNPLSLIEFPADDPERALAFWRGLLDLDFAPRAASQGEGWQSNETQPVVGVHLRGRGPGDTFSLPYFSIGDLPQALERVKELGGTVIHPGESFAVCRDSEGSPFGLAAEAIG